MVVPFGPRPAPRAEVRRAPPRGAQDFSPCLRATPGRGQLLGSQPFSSHRQAYLEHNLAGRVGRATVTPIKNPSYGLDAHASQNKSAALFPAPPALDAHAPQPFVLTFLPDSGQLLAAGDSWLRATPGIATLFFANAHAYVFAAAGLKEAVHCRESCRCITRTRSCPTLSPASTSLQRGVPETRGEGKAQSIRVGTCPEGGQESAGASWPAAPRLPPAPAPGERALSAWAGNSGQGGSAGLGDSLGPFRVSLLPILRATLCHTCEWARPAATSVDVQSPAPGSALRPAHACGHARTCTT